MNGNPWTWWDRYTLQDAVRVAYEAGLRPDWQSLAAQFGRTVNAVKCYASLSAATSHFDARNTSRRERD